MAARRRANRVITIYTSGGRANSQSDLASRVGRVVKRNDNAVKVAARTTAKAAPAIAKSAILTGYSIGLSKLEGKVTAKATAQTVIVSASVRRMPLSEFSANWGGPNAAGATAAVVRGMKKTYPGAFMAKGRIAGAQTRLVYQRTGKKKKQIYGYHKGKVRESIRNLRGPSPWQMLRDPRQGTGDVRGTAQRLIAERYITELRRAYAAE